MKTRLTNHLSRTRVPPSRAPWPLSSSPLGVSEILAAGARDLDNSEPTPRGLHSLDAFLEIRDHEE